MMRLLKSSVDEAGKALTTKFAYYFKSCFIYFVITILLYFLLFIPLTIFKVGLYSGSSIVFNFITELVTMWALSIILLKYSDWFVGRNALDEKFIAGLSGFIVFMSFMIAVVLFIALNLMASSLPAANLGPQIQSILKAIMSSFFLIPLSILIKFSFLYFFVNFNRACTNMLLGLDLFIILSFFSLAIVAIAQSIGSAQAFSISAILSIFNLRIIDALLANSQTLFVIVSGLAIVRDRYSGIFFEALWLCFIFAIANIILFGNNLEYAFFFGLVALILYLLRGRN